MTTRERGFLLLGSGITLYVILITFFGCPALHP
jgi:hypothetical protein